MRWIHWHAAPMASTSDAAIDSEAELGALHRQPLAEEDDEPNATPGMSGISQALLEEPAAREVGGSHRQPFISLSSSRAMLRRLR